MASVEQAGQTATTNGEVHDGAGIPVENPASGQVIATVPELSAEQVHELARRGRAAQPGWEALGFEGRARVLLRMQKWVLDNAERVVETIISETGKTYEDAQLAEISYAASAFGFWAKNAEEFLADERIRASSPLVLGRKLVVRYRPLGLVGVIGPWNYPLTNSFGDCIPALAAGNSVILKPSEITPLTSLLMLEALQECGMPENVYQVATGRGETGAALVDEVDMIMFTGSTRTGKKVMERAAQTVTPVSLQMGGKDPMIVLVDVDHSMQCMTEETFGPTLPIMKVQDADEAVRMANESPYGLAGSVFTRDNHKGEAIARRVEAGAVCVNDAMLNYSALELPMGGWKASGLGSRHGANGIRKYTRQQTLLVTPKLAARKRDVHMIPYRKSTTRMLGRLFRLLWGRGKRG